MDGLCGICFCEQDFIEAVAEHGFVLSQAELSFSKAVIDVLSDYEFVLADSFDAT